MLCKGCHQALHPRDVVFNIERHANCHSTTSKKLPSLSIARKALLVKLEEIGEKQLATSLFLEIPDDPFHYRCIEDTNGALAVQLGSGAREFCLLITPKSEQMIDFEVNLVHLKSLNCLASVNISS
ncbi:hypothetical protein HJ030_18320 [Vibrio parahaemolyticus]|nr:hypothetical protein [Vibrio parahaemolyticus]